MHDDDGHDEIGYVDANHVVELGADVVQCETFEDDLSDSGSDGIDDEPVTHGGDPTGHAVSRPDIATDHEAGDREGQDDLKRRVLIFREAHENRGDGEVHDGDEQGEGQHLREGCSGPPEYGAQDAINVPSGDGDEWQIEDEMREIIDHPEVTFFELGVNLASITDTESGDDQHHLMNDEQEEERTEEGRVGERRSIEYCLIVPDGVNDGLSAFASDAFWRSETIQGKLIVHVQHGLLNGSHDGGVEHRVWRVDIGCKRSSFDAFDLR